MNIFKQKYRVVKDKLRRYGQKSKIPDCAELVYYGTEFWVERFLAEEPQTWDWIISGYMAFWCGEEVRKFIDFMFFRGMNVLCVCERLHISERTCYVWRESVLSDFTGFAVQFSLAEIDIADGRLSERDETACTLAFEITDEQWSKIERILAAAAKYGSKKTRREIEAIAAVKFSDISWRDVPKSYGAWKTVYNRYNELCKAGLWDKIETVLEEK